MPRTRPVRGRRRGPGVPVVSPAPTSPPTIVWYHRGGPMTIELTDKDFVPLAQCEFQHWGEHSGPPFCHMRALSPDAAERVWRKTAETCGAEWCDRADEHLD